MSDHLKFFNPETTIDVSHNQLPHWQQPCGTYFITFRLHDAIPASTLKTYIKQKQEWLENAPVQPWPEELQREYHRRFTMRFERWLDQGHGACLLSSEKTARILQGALEHFEGERSLMHCYVIMPNHVHLLTSLLGTTTLESIMKSWKGFSSRHINLELGRIGTLWQKSYHDRMIRSWDHFIQCARYIRNNPAKARLDPASCLHDESPLVRRMLA